MECIILKIINEFLSISRALVKKSTLLLHWTISFVFKIYLNYSLELLYFVLQLLLVKQQREYLLYKVLTSQNYFENFNRIIF